MIHNYAPRFQLILSESRIIPKHYILDVPRGIEVVESMDPIDNPEFGSKIVI